MISDLKKQVHTHTHPFTFSILCFSHYSHQKTTLCKTACAATWNGWIVPADVKANVSLQVKPGTPIQTTHYWGKGGHKQPVQTQHLTFPLYGPQCCTQLQWLVESLKMADARESPISVRMGERKQKQLGWDSWNIPSRVLSLSNYTTMTKSWRTLYSPSRLCSSRRCSSATSRPPLSSSLGRKWRRVEEQYLFQRVGCRGRHSMIFSLSSFSILQRDIGWTFI